MAGEHLQVGAVDQRLDSLVRLVGLAAVLSAGRDDEFRDRGRLALGRAASGQQAELGVRARPEAHADREAVARRGGLRPGETDRLVGEAPGDDHLQRAGEHRLGGPHQEDGIVSGPGGDGERHDVVDGHAAVVPLGRPPFALRRACNESPGRVGVDHCGSGRPAGSRGAHYSTTVGFQSGDPSACLRSRGAPMRGHPGVKIAAGINDATTNLEINRSIAGHAPFVQRRRREFQGILQPPACRSISHRRKMEHLVEHCVLWLALQSST